MRSSHRALLGLVPLLAPALVSAQSQGGWLSAGAAYQTPVSTPTLGGYTLLGATFGHSISGKTALAVSFGSGTGIVQPAATVNPTDGTAWVPPRSRRDHLDVNGELRLRLSAARDLDRSEFYVVAGGGMLRSHLADEAAVVAPQTHAGLAMTFPLGEALGFEFRAVYVAAQLRPQDIGIAPIYAPGATAPTYAPARWAGGVRAGVSFFLRPIARPRRIPPQFVPDATMVPAPTTSYEGMFLRRDSVAAIAAAEGDVRSVGDPDASAGGTIRGEYLTRRTPYVDPQAVVSRRTAPSKAARDTIYTLADTVGAPPATDPVPAPIVKRPRSKPSPTASATRRAASNPGVRVDSTQIHAVAEAVRGAVRDAVVAGVRDGVADVERSRGGARAIPVEDEGTGDDAPPSPTTIREDSVATESDGRNDFLVIRPATSQGHIRSVTTARLTALASRYLSAGRDLDFAIIVETTPADGTLNESLLEDAYVLRTALIDVGVPAARVLVREVPTGEAHTTLRILLRSPRIAAR